MASDPLYLAQMCAASYAGYKGPSLHLPNFVWCYSTTEYVEMRRLGAVVYLIFRGSDDPTDWKRNIDSHLVDVEGGQISHGVLTGWKELERAIRERLNLISYHRLVITGHSRGGALAYLAGRAFAEDPVTFGCPNFCDKEFAYSQAGTNYIAGKWPLLRDPVPRVPYFQHRPGTDIVLTGYGRPSRMHRISNYVKLLMRQK